MSMLLFASCDLWSIIGDSGFVVSSVVSSVAALLSFHVLTGKMGTRPARLGIAPRLETIKKRYRNISTADNTAF
jgi:hypothetical protein